MKSALLRGLAEVVCEACTLSFHLVLALTLAYFLLPRHGVSLFFDYLHAWMRSDRAGTAWLLMCIGCLVMKLLADAVLHRCKTKET